VQAFNFLGTMGTPSECAKANTIKTERHPLKRRWRKEWRWRESNIIPWMETPSEMERAPCWVRVRQSGDAGNRISSPEWGPRPKWNAHPCWVRVRQSGDAGNRTRVRKNRPSEIYERSRSKVVTTGISSGKNRLRPAALSFAQVAA